MTERTNEELAVVEKLDSWSLGIEEWMELGESLSQEGMGRLKNDLEEACRHLREQGERVEGCEVACVTWNKYGCLELLIRLPQGPVGHEVKVTDLATLILNPQEKS